MWLSKRTQMTENILDTDIKEHYLVVLCVCVVCASAWKWGSVRMADWLLCRFYVCHICIKSWLDTCMFIKKQFLPVCLVVCVRVCVNLCEQLLICLVEFGGPAALTASDWCDLVTQVKGQEPLVSICVWRKGHQEGIRLESMVLVTCVLLETHAYTYTHIVLLWINHPYPLSISIYTGVKPLLSLPPILLVQVKLTSWEICLKLIIGCYSYYYFAEYKSHYKWRFPFSVINIMLQ